MQCRKDQGDGDSDCSAYCKSEGYEMKGCMKSDGMAEWRGVEHWSAQTTSGDHSWSCSTDSTGGSCACGENSLIETANEVEEAGELVVEESQSPLEVCCLCQKETGESTDWLIKSYADDASADLQGDSFMQCRKDQGDGDSDCSAYCKSEGYEMKGCMKSDGMAEWRGVEHWSAQTTSGDHSWSCSTDAKGGSCACGENSLVEIEEEVAVTSNSSTEEESTFCTPRCVTESNCKLGQEMQIWSRTNKMWCPGTIVGSDGKRSPDAVLKKKTVACPNSRSSKGITVNYTCKIKGKPTKFKKMVLWKDPKGDNVGKMVQYNSMFR